MTNNQIRSALQADIVDFRHKAKFYESLHLHEAKRYAEHLASNIELALTTLPSDADPALS